MITSQQQDPKRNPVHGQYVRVAVADLELGNVWIYGIEPSTHEAQSLDSDTVQLNAPVRDGYR